MSHQSRLSFWSAIHLIEFSGPSGQHIFFDPVVLAKDGDLVRNSAPSALHMECLLMEVCEEYGAVIRGYEIEPNSISLVVQTFGAAIPSIMRELRARYAEHAHQIGRVPRGISAFGGRYLSKVVAPAYLPHAIRRIHRRPLKAGLCADISEYPFSSDRVYRGAHHIRSRISTDAVVAALEARGMRGVNAYAQFVELPETRYVAALFEFGWPLDTRVIGGRVFAQEARQAASRTPTCPSRQMLVDAVAKVLHTTPEEIYLSTHTGSRGRALVAWHATRTGAATRKEVGRWFSLTTSALRHSIRYHRRARPDLFEANLGALANL